MSITNCDEFYLKKYDSFLMTLVNRFIYKGNGNCSTIKDDLIQEARIALLKWIKKQGSLEFDIYNSVLDINYSLYECVKQNTGIHMRPHDLKNFYNDYQIIPLEENRTAFFDWAAIDFKLDFCRWYNALTVKQKRILKLKMTGFNGTEIAKKLKTSQQYIAETIDNAIRNSYNAYFHPEQNPAPVRKRKSKSAPTAA